MSNCKDNYATATQLYLVVVVDKSKCISWYGWMLSKVERLFRDGRIVNKIPASDEVCWYPRLLLLHDEVEPHSMG